MSDSGIHQSSARATRRQGTESIGSWRDSPLTAADGDVPVVALGRAEASVQGLAKSSGELDRAVPLHSPVASFFHGAGTAGSADQRQSQGSVTPSLQCRHPGVPGSTDTGSNIAAVLDFAVGLGAPPESEHATVESELAQPDTVAAETLALGGLQLPPRGRGVSTTFESALGLGSGDSWYRPSERSGQRPAGSLPSHQPVKDRSTYV